MVLGVGQCSWPRAEIPQDIHERTVIMALDEDFNVIGQDTLRLHMDQDSWGRTDRRVRAGDDDAAIKFDDAKLLMHHGRVFVTFRNLAYPHKIQLLNPLALDIQPNGPGQVDLRARVEASKTVEVCCGGNIGFMSPPGGDPDVIYALVWITPMQITKIHLSTGVSEVHLDLPEDQQGATQPKAGDTAIHGTSGNLPYISETNEFIGLAHIHRPTNRKRSKYALHGHHYTHLYFAVSADVLADPNGKPWEERLRMGNEFTFPSLAWAAALPGAAASAPDYAVEDSEIIQYAGGLSLHVGAGRESSTVLVSYGVNDCESAVYSMSLEEVLATGLSGVEHDSLLAPLSSRLQ
mmetsp:Transcript_1444/g.3803  ORF Transcript_1444/g.3803 Transcript_1444/m.3803 type:complete len:349 (+) Transcript_1444:2028-3074(+)